MSSDTTEPTVSNTIYGATTRTEGSYVVNVGADGRTHVASTGPTRTTVVETEIQKRIRETSERLKNLHTTRAEIRRDVAVQRVLAAVLVEAKPEYSIYCKTTGEREDCFDALRSLGYHGIRCKDDMHLGSECYGIFFYD